jgi:hypothetical protein
MVPSPLVEGRLRKNVKFKKKAEAPLIKRGSPPHFCILPFAFLGASLRAIQASKGGYAYTGQGHHLLFCSRLYFIVRRFVRE